MWTHPLRPHSPNTALFLCKTQDNNVNENCIAQILFLFLWEPVNLSLVRVASYVLVWLHCIRKIKKAIMSGGTAVIKHAYIQIAHLT